jgi:carbon-monoxide dehydrogenase small subunit
MLVSAFDLLQRNRRPSSGDVRGALSGNLCRCTGYKKIVEAVLAAAATLLDEVVK